MKMQVCGHGYPRRYCRECSNAYMREWRKTHTLSESERIKDRARSILAVNVKRGKVIRQRCEECGSDNTEAHHHAGYDKPLVVQWLCRPHHREQHTS